MAPDGGTKRHWLLVLPASARFVYRGGRVATDSYERCLDTLTRYQHLTGVAPLTARFLSVQGGDMLWLALRNIGVVARGVVETVHGRPEAEVRFVVDPDASRILAADPIPARHMGKVAVGLKDAAPTALHDQPAAIEAFEWWWRELGALDTRRLKVLDDVQPSRDTKGWAKRIAADPVLAGASRALRGAGLSVGVPGKSSQLDLVGLDKSRIIGMVAIGGTPKQATETALSGLGHGMHELWSLQQSLDDPAMQRSFWLAFPSAPDLPLVEFLEATSAGVVWLDRGAIRPGPRTAVELAQLAKAPLRGLE